MAVVPSVGPLHAVVAEFEQHQPTPLAGVEAGSGVEAAVFVLGVCHNVDGSATAASLSNGAVKVFDASFRVLRELPHAQESTGGTVTDVEFSPGDPNVLFSSDSLGAVRVFDVRAQRPEVLRVTPGGGEEAVWSLAVGCGGHLLAAACGPTVQFHDLRAAHQRVGVYADSHTDLVTEVVFEPEQQTLLLTGGEDGLMCMYDTTRATADDALVCIMNPNCAVRRVGFFGPHSQGAFCLTGTETLSLWHAGTAQCIRDWDSVREQSHSWGLGVPIDYLVNCHYDAAAGKLVLVAGGWAGGAVLCDVTDQAVTPVRQLTGGHRAVIRTSSLQPRRSWLVTGAEDARVCAWDLTGADASISGATEREAGGHASTAHRRPSHRRAGAAGADGAAGPARSQFHRDAAATAPF